MNKPAASIFIKQLELSVYLGWALEERSKKQIVNCDIHLLFPSPPKACVSDDLADTICYDDLITQIKNKIEQQTFRLLEHLGHDIYTLIVSNVSDKMKVHIQLTKQPAISQLAGGVCFSYGNLE